MPTLTCEDTSRWASYVERYRAGEWRARIFRDMILDDAKEIGNNLTFLDIGCGQGFDGDLKVQQSLVKGTGAYIGIEPDANMSLGSYFTETHPCLFEECPLPSGSVHVAFAVMVLEHLPQPDLFWDKLCDVLEEGGVFWGFTMDGRHEFCRFSLWAERLRIKELYLTQLRGTRGVDQYENYPVYYRSNTPEEILKYTRHFRSCDFVTFSKVGQLNYYVPRPLRPLANLWDQRAIRKRKPGSILGIRVSK